MTRAIHKPEYRSRRQKRNDRPIVFVPRPRCPGCGMTDIDVRSSLAQGDGSQLRYCRCRSCGERFKVVLE